MDKLDPFETIVLKELMKYCESAVAEEVMTRYLPVMREINDDHDGAAIQAEHYWKAYQKNIDPDRWMERIAQVKKKYNQ